MPPHPSGIHRRTIQFEGYLELGVFAVDVRSRFRTCWLDFAMDPVRIRHQFHCFQMDCFWSKSHWHKTIACHHKLYGRCSDGIQTVQKTVCKAQHFCDGFSLDPSQNPCRTTKNILWGVGFFCDGFVMENNSASASQNFWGSLQLSESGIKLVTANTLTPKP